MEEPMTDKKTGLAILREPFPANQISKLPKPTKRQTDEVRDDYKKGIRCKVCGQWHHKDVVHLDYVGHAALTDRLLDCDPEWNWEPMAYSENGLPAFQGEGMWIKLTVCGVTRLGYGDAPGKKGGDAIKEVIGDALRNAAMRFGAALDLWHKGDLHVDDAPEQPEPKREQRQKQEPSGPPQEAIDTAKTSLAGADSLDQLTAIWKGLPKNVQNVPELIQAGAARKAELQADAEHDKAVKDDLGGDEIPH
jgi:hypothetical protein